MKMPLNQSVEIDILNQEEVERLWPLLLYLAVIVMAGLPGNIVVCIVYRRNAAQSNCQFFMTWLAVIDCFSCCMVFLEINNVVHQYTYQWAWLCKFTIFLELWSVIISALTLCVIGIDRYIKICNPHGRQMSYTIAKMICGFIVLLGLSLSWPSLILFGVRDISIQPYNVTGTTCSIQNEFDKTSYIRVFNGLLWIVFAVALTIIIILYILIGKRIFKHVRKYVTELYPKLSKKNITKPSVTTESTDDGSSTDTRMIKKTSIPSPEDSSTTAINTISRTNMHRRESQVRRSAFIMFLISLVFIISFLPYLMLRLVDLLDAEFYYSMSDGTRAVYQFFLRCYFLNCAVNPFIYCACATKFRNDAKALIVCLFRRCKV